MNKYVREARQARAARKIDRMCTSKRRYESEESSRQKNQRSYLCPHCNGWHRSGKFEELVKASQHPTKKRHG